MSLPEQRPAALRDAVRLASELLARAGVDGPTTDARLLLAHALGAAPTWLFLHEEREVPAPAWERFRDLVQRRSSREPLQYVLGEHEFWSLRVGVGPEVLVPRPETEHLVEAALAAVRGQQVPRIADVGTGSGCIALALASELPLARLVATDLSPAALDRARSNAEQLGFEDRIAFLPGDFTEPLRGGEPLDALVANLPYVSAEEWPDLQPEVRDHEPRSALVAGDGGLELVARLIAEAPGVLRDGGFLGLEIGWTQAARVASLLAAAGWSGIDVARDFAGHERVVTARRPA